MSYRDLERAKAKAEAAKEPLNANNYRRDQSPASTRLVAEAAETNRAPEPEPTQRDHSVAAGTASISYVGNVRERLESTAAKKRDEKPTPVMVQDENAKRWADYNEAYRQKHGCYPSN